METTPYPLLPWFVVLPFVAALLAPFLHRVVRGATGALLALIPLFILVNTAQFAPFEIGQALSQRLPWIPSLGIELAFRLDGLAEVFTSLISGIGILVLLYASGYLAGDPRLGLFYATLMAFMGSMLGLVLSDNLILLFVFWELTSVCSYLLIGFNHETRASRDAALKALLVTGLGGLALLAGLLLLGLATSQLGAPIEATWRLSTLGDYPLTEHALYPGLLGLILIGAFTKSAQFPFHFWLPSAMAAPTPVSAYLHSATMVKAGIYLLARLHPVLGDTVLWHFLVGSAGAITMLLCAVLAACQTDLKRILAFSTISVLGTLTMLLGMGTPKAIKAALVLLGAHALYKAALFMVAGNIDHETGTRDVTRLGGLRRVMPFTAFAGILAALSNAGAPPMFGFLGKEALYAAKLDLEMLAGVSIITAVVTNVFLTATALVVAIWPFFGPRRETPKHPHEAPIVMLIGPVLLTVASLLIGLLAGTFDTIMGSAAASAIAGRPMLVNIKLWHGISTEALTVLGLSILTLACGFVVFLRLRDWIGHLTDLFRRIDDSWGMNAQYERFLPCLMKTADTLTRVIQNGFLRRYLMVVILGVSVLVVVPLLRSLTVPMRLEAGPIHWHELALAVLILSGAALAVASRSRLVAVVAVGVSGFAIAILFAVFSAPDLAITQILVETLSVVLFVIVFLHLPPYSIQRTTAQRSRDLPIALAAGTLMTLLVLSATSVRLPAATADYFARVSQPQAYGRNVVNVILVDFRALDTLGETTVVAVAGLGVFALLRHRLRNRHKDAS